MEVKIDEKSIQKWSQDGKASWHRFLMDFGGFWEPSWDAKSNQDRSGWPGVASWRGAEGVTGVKGVEGVEGVKGVKVGRGAPTA